MTYRRVLLLIDLEAGAGAALDTIRHVAPHAELLLIVTRVAASLRTAAAGAAASVEIRVDPDLDAAGLADLAAAARIDLLATHSLQMIGEARRRQPLAVLWLANERAGGETIVCLARGERARRAVGRFLRDHATRAQRVTAYVNATPPDVAPLLGIAGIAAQVELTASLPSGPFDLAVTSHVPGALFAARMWRTPVLILPPLEVAAPAPDRAMDVADVVDLDGVLRFRAHYAIGVGRREPIPDQTLAIVSGGRVMATVTTEDGAAELIPAPRADALGIYRTRGRRNADPLACIEQEVAVIRPGARPLVLFDSNVAPEVLSRLDGVDLLAVRMRVTESAHAIRTRLAKAGLSGRVIDARAALDEGSALDVGEDLDAVRLARVAARMRAAGFPVTAIVHRGAVTPSTTGFVALRAEELRLPLSPPGGERAGVRGLTHPLEVAADAPLIAGNRVELEMDNTQARRWLLDAIAAATDRVHLQIYMAADDEAGRTVEAALAEAGARGVKVRVVVDSLHGFHGSLGISNPLLERLGNSPGVELRALDPITTAPSLVDLKQRDHRKIAVIDGETALVGGRNLSHEYYTGFDEVQLNAQSPWREVPWLDAGARVHGPAVAEIERSFLEVWTAAGGAPFDIIEPPPAGTSAVRVVLHHGLRDAHTLDAYVALIDGARSHVYTVNGFPLMLEIQHALLRALRRGVRVRTLFGNLTPTHGDTPFAGAFSSARIEATQLVHSRMDALVAAGAEAHQFALPEHPHWERGLGTLQPHVHAKVMSVDGRVCSVGSANLDITAGYWESELVLIVEDPAIASALEAHIDELLRHSARVDRNDPEWQELAARREWMRKWPGVMSV